MYSSGMPVLRCNAHVFRLLLLIALTSALQAQSPAPFSIDSKELLRQGQSAGQDKSADAVVLLDEETDTLDPDSKVHRAFHLIFVVQNQQGVEGWSSLRHTWEPWHEKRPVIEARVITPDGLTHRLDPATIVDGPAKQGAADTFSDARVVKVPIPAIVPGAVVEQVVTIDETLPEFPAGLLDRFYFGRNDVRVLQSLLVLDFPESLPVQYEALKLPDLKIEKANSAGRIHVEFRMGAMDPIAEEPPLLPSTAVFWPSVVFSSGESWPAVARSYNTTVEAKLAGTKIAKLACSLSPVNPIAMPR